MFVEFQFKDSLNIFNKAEIIGNFNLKNMIMTKKEDNWFCKIELKDGVYVYKYVFDDYIRLNDPQAKEYIIEENGEVWSKIEIQNNQIVLIENLSQVIVNQYVITDKLANKISSDLYRNVFNKIFDEKVAIGISLEGVSKTHSLTVIWYQPDMSIHHIEEQALSPNCETETSNALLWLWINLNDYNRQYLYGLWSVDIYLDGYNIVHDKFSLYDGISSHHIFNVKV